MKHSKRANIAFEQLKNTYNKELLVQHFNEVEHLAVVTLFKQNWVFWGVCFVLGVTLGMFLGNVFT